MAAFEHVTALVAFVFALAMAHVLSTVVALVRAGKRVHYSFVHAVWFITAPISVFLWWLSLYNFHSLKQWTVTSIAWWLVAATLVYLYTGFVCPEVPSEGSLDLNQFHLTHARQYLGAALANDVVSLILGFYGIRSNLPDQVTQIAFSAVLAVPTLIAFAFRNRTVQNVCAALQLASIPVYFFFGQQPLS